MFCADVFLGNVEIRQHDDRGSGTRQYILVNGKIFVHNASYHKRVGFHVDVDGVWIDVDTTYSHSLLTGGGNVVEVWKTRELGEELKRLPITTPMPPRPEFKFAVYYHNLDWGTSHWDNNFGRDYSL